MVLVSTVYKYSMGSCPMCAHRYCMGGWEGETGAAGPSPSRAVLAAQRAERETESMGTVSAITDRVTGCGGRDRRDNY